MPPLAKPLSPSTLVPEGLTRPGSATGLHSGYTAFALRVKVCLLHVGDKFCFQNQAGSTGGITQLLGQIWFLPPLCQTCSWAPSRGISSDPQGPAGEALSKAAFRKHSSHLPKASSSDSYTYCVRCYSRCTGHSWPLWLARSLKATAPR